VNLSGPKRQRVALNKQVLPVESGIMTTLKKTALHALHVELGAKMVEFAGYDMPVQYPLGIMNEHLHTREKAGLFDVSHMGQCFIAADDGTFETAAKALEKLVPASIQDLEPGQQRYSQLLNKDGGILDDLMISRLGLQGHTHQLYLVVNAGCKEADYKHIKKHLPKGVSLSVKDDVLSLIAEAGLCLYGHDIDTSTNPIEAGLIWSIQKHRREGGNYLGAKIVEATVKNKPKRKLVGILPEGRAPAREHTEVQDMDGNTIGEITSGGFGPTVGGPVAMGYVSRKFSKAGTPVQLIVRGKARPASVVKMPFAPHRYFRG